MANTNRMKNKNDKLSTGKRKKTMRLEEVEELKFLSANERIQYVIENSHLIKDKLLIQKRNNKLSSKHNDTDLSNQSNSDSSKNKPNKTKAESESEIIIKLEDDNEVIQNACDNKTKPAGQSNLNETKKAKKQRQKSKSNNKNCYLIEITIDADPLSLTYYQCDHCQRKFGMKSSLQRHMLMHLDIKPFSCSYCPNRKFRQRDNWRAHMARKHKEAFKRALKYECKICKKPFVLLSHMKLHLKVHADEKRTCRYCGKVFKEQCGLAQHEKCHTTPGRYKCATCSMSFDTRPLFSNHLKCHSQAQDFACQLCGKSFQLPNSLTRHIQVNHGGMRRQCPICNKLFKGHLHEHMRTHENQRPHKCDKCGQKFTQSTQLSIHKRSHTGTRPYPCRICKQSFTTSSILMLHIRRHTGEKPFECAMCPQTFSQLPHMKAHMRNIHNKTEFYKCNNCNTFFKLQSLLEAHAEQCGDAASVQKKDKNDDILLSRMRFLLALHLTMTTSEVQLKKLGFNKRLIDDILADSIEAMGLKPLKDAALAPLPRLQSNASLLLRATVPKHQMALFVKENKSTEEILELTDKGILNKKLTNTTRIICQ